MPEDAAGGVRKPTGAVMFLSVAQAMKTEWRSLAVLGVISAVYFCLTVVLTALVDGGQFMRNYFLNEPLTAELMANSSVQMASLVQTLLTLPLLLAMWHAPALVHWHRVEPVKSIFFSLVAVFRNFGAYALFGLVWCGVFLLAIIAVALVATVVIGVGSLGSGAGAMAIGNVLMIGTVLTLAATAQARTGSPSGTPTTRTDRARPADAFQSAEAPSLRRLANSDHAMPASSSRPAPRAPHSHHFFDDGSLAGAGGSAVAAAAVTAAAGKATDALSAATGLSAA